MKYSKKILSLILAAVLVFSVIFASAFQSLAVNKFTDGDFEYAVVSEGVIYVSAYLGDDTSVTLPYIVNGEAVKGIYKECFKDSAVSSVKIPDQYVSIGDLAFYGCHNLTSVKMPSDLKSVGTMAFYNCENLSSVDFSDVRQLSSLSFAMFSGCKSLEKVYLPESVTTLNENIFVDCESLTEVKMSDNIKLIPEYAFYGCASLSNIEIPSKLEKIEQYAFANCKSLSEVDIPSSLTDIGNNAFENDTALSSLFIPDTVTSIGANAFIPMSYTGNIEITCYEDSYAAEYCNGNSVSNLVKVEKKLGDVNMDGVVDILDVTNIQQYKIGTYDISTYRQKTLSDVNKDGSVTVRDATLIQMYLAHYFDSFDDEIQ